MNNGAAEMILGFNHKNELVIGRDRNKVPNVDLGSVIFKHDPCSEAPLGALVVWNNGEIIGDIKTINLPRTCTEFMDLISNYILLKDNVKITVLNNERIIDWINDESLLDEDYILPITSTLPMEAYSVPFEKPINIYLKKGTTADEDEDIIVDDNAVTDFFYRDIYTMKSFDNINKRFSDKYSEPTGRIYEQKILSFNDKESFVEALKDCFCGNYDADEDKTIYDMLRNELCASCKVDHDADEDEDE